MEENHKGLLGQSIWPGSLRASVTAWPCLLISSQEGPLFPGVQEEPRVARIMSNPCHESRKDLAAPDPLKGTQCHCTTGSPATQHGALEQTNPDLSAPAMRPLQPISTRFNRPFLKSTNSFCQVQASLPAQASRVTPHVLYEERSLQAASFSWTPCPESLLQSLTTAEPHRTLLF